MKFPFKQMLAALLLGAAVSFAAPIEFIYEGNSYGTMEITFAGENTAKVTFTAADIGSIPGVTDYQVTGFAFDFENSYLVGGSVSGLTIANESSDGLNWIVLKNLNAIPNSSNDDTKKSTFEFGVTEGKANNINPPGINMGGSDYFLLSGFYNVKSQADIDNAFLINAIRIQALQPGDKSLLLVGTRQSVPEPSTILLLGIGMLSICAYRRKRS